LAAVVAFAQLKAEINLVVGVEGFQVVNFAKLQAGEPELLVVLARGYNGRDEISLVVVGVEVVAVCVAQGCVVPAQGVGLACGGSLVQLMRGAIHPHGHVAKVGVGARVKRERGGTGGPQTCKPRQRYYHQGKHEQNAKERHQNALYVLVHIQAPPFFVLCGLRTFLLL